MLIYALTILVSSFLLFLVQPIIAKQILPWFGGSAAVWTTCLAFFQMVLLAGYAYSDLVQRLRPRPQALLHMAILLVSLATLPILAGEHWKPIADEDPWLRILGLLTVTIGLPYFMLSTTGPLIQSWFAREQPDPTTAQKAYRLFALSNFGSLLGLLAYPFVIEPWVSTRLQGLAWSGAYALFVGLTLWVAFRARQHGARTLGEAAVRTSQPDQEGPVSTEAWLETLSVRPRFHDMALWFSLAALATLMLLSVSSHVTQNIASIPFLWVVPLSLYLLTFVVAFEGRGGLGWYSRDTMMLPALAVAGLMAWGLVADDGILDIEYAIPLYVCGLFLICLFCHGELARAKPEPRYLTRFYFMIALGGAAGGLFVSALAPRVFPFYWELPLGLVLVGAMGLWIALVRTAKPLQTLFVGGSLLSMAAAGLYATQFVQDAQQDSTYASRNFYGTLRIKERRHVGSIEPVRRLVHGVILHGLQDMDPRYRSLPTTYYGRSSGVGIAIEQMGLQSPAGIQVGVIGLGVGTLAAYGRKGDHYRMYEINAQVIDLANQHFSYLQDSAASISFALGDARLVLEREAPRQFDVLVIDAFSSDSIPIHLITREALAVFERHMKPQGVIVFHVTNRYLDLAPVVRNLAAAAGYQAVLISDDPATDTRGLLAYSDWVLVTRNTRLLEAKPVKDKRYPIDDLPQLGIWTDDFNNLFRVLK